MATYNPETNWTLAATAGCFLTLQNNASCEIGRASLSVDFSIVKIPIEASVDWSIGATAQCHATLQPSLSAAASVGLFASFLGRLVPNRSTATLCKPLFFESNGNSPNGLVSGLDARWLRGLDLDQWQEGSPPTMSASPTIIKNSGTPLLNPTPSSLWIDQCSYDPSVSFPLAAANIPGSWPSGAIPSNLHLGDGILEWKQDLGTFEGWVPISSSSAIVPGTGILPSGASGRWTGSFTGRTQREIYLADSTLKRGMRMGIAFDITSAVASVNFGISYAYDFYGHLIGTTYSGDVSLDSLTWDIRAAIYIKNCCDFSNPFQERDVQIVEMYKSSYTTRFNNIKTYTGSDTALVNALNNHRSELYRYLSNVNFMEDEQRKLPVSGPIDFRLKKQGSRIEFGLLNQYTKLTASDSFNSRPLRIYFPQTATNVRASTI